MGIPKYVPPPPPEIINRPKITISSDGMGDDFASHVALRICLAFAFFTMLIVLKTTNCG